MILAIAGCFLISNPAATPDWRAMVGTYEFVHWKNSNDSVETLYLLDERKRVVTAVRGFYVAPWGDQAWRKRVVRPLQNILGKGRHEIVITEWSGGAHGSKAYYIWTLGPKPRCILAYDKNNVIDGKDMVMTDLNGDGVNEILSFYDGFSYELGTAYGGMLPFVLEYRSGRYRNATSKYRKVVRKWEADARKDLAGIDRNEERASTAFREVATRIDALGLLSHNEPQTLRYLRKRLPISDYQWLLGYRGRIRQVVGDMDKRLMIVKPYQKKVVNTYRVDE